MLHLESYQNWLKSLKYHIHHSQQRAMLAVNSEMVLLYWKIGQEILQRQQSEGWGAKVIDQLSRDLTAEFPDMKGFSSRNLKYMRKFAQEWTEFEIVQGVLAQLPWYHQIALLDKLSDEQERLWYARKAIENGWSRNMLVHQIESQLFYRQGIAITNFDKTLPDTQSDLARQAFKDPYIFDFLNLTKQRHERELEQALTKHITQFLLELGAGFSFLGSQVKLNVGGDDFYIDLLFYHLKLRCYVVIELKTCDFKPEHIGQLNFYLTVVDNQLKTEIDTPTIGLLLCKNRNKVVVEYALQNNPLPIGVAEYQLQQLLAEFDME
ncbi:hypothetical protein HPS174_1130 [Glaesserella parasuis 174]|uniref:PDDEXK nuclease domain-containing protein n=2 Tax=Glaesserella parasuis TaxID=738 RepID=UPI0003AC0486|nr:PDDEXK nuclease domain-containing protein [Glaesserella parasuis]EQA12484.1 hypothetical protein HPS174_1130 [Glaesserella parasuis 174]MDD2170428.1 PDDEXK nuclease domain-containing protein [Glaesserella parasuis]MDP0406432.1 PDDEXK nuclease domain-containing protein [Glaesserella parasuis]QIE73234.1 DUF1016 domain-containing protein [Glaesserella parasuis]